MKGYRFRLDAVLRVRRLQEEQARAALLRARMDAEEATVEHKRRLSILRRRLMETTSEGPSEAFLEERDRRERLAAAVLASRAAEAHAGHVSETRLSDWEQAAQELATLERLDEHQRAAFVAGVLAAEQQATDEQATMRAARADRLRAERARRAADAEGTP